MAIPDEFFTRLKDSCDIVAVMTPYVNLKRANRDYTCLCPFHSEKTASCHVYTDNQNFYCFGCGAGGDVITFIRLIENLDYMEAVRFLSEKAGLQIPEDGTSDKLGALKIRILEMNRAAARFFRDTLNSSEGSEGLDYFYRRGLSPNTIKKYGLGYAPDSWDKLKMHLRGLGWSDDEMIEASLLVQGKNGTAYDKFRHRVMFPIIDRRGNVIGFGGRVLSAEQEPKYLNSSETAVFRKRENLFSLNFAKNSKEKYLLLCEGNMDVIALNQAGYENSVATLGTAITPEQARLMRTYCEEVIIAYDADGAGQAATMKAINLLSEAGLAARVLQLNDAKDPDEFLQKYGKEAFAELIEKAGSVISFELKKIEKGLNADSPEGKAEYLKKAVELLTRIENRIERSVYISIVAKFCDITTQNVEIYIDERIKRKNRYAANDENRKLIRGSMPQKSGREYADEKKYPSEASAERGIISYIFHSPDKLVYILSKVSPEDFPTVFNRRLLETLVLRIKRQHSIDIQSLGSEFSAEEVGRIEGIKRESMLLPFTVSRLDDYIKILLDFKRLKNKKSPAEMTDNELLELQEKLRSK